VLSSVEVLVVDEADRMFDMGFIMDIRYLIRHLPPAERRQSSLFSATLSQQVLELAYESMNYPTMVAIAPEHVTVEGVEEVLYHVSKEEKFSLLLGLLEREKGKRIMMFANMKHEVERLARGLLRHGYHARAITGDVDQKKRLSIMQAFKEGGLHILVATDVASRGLHIEGVTHVINYDLPQDPEDYVHRIGRTARAGAPGKAISLADEKYVMSLEAIEALIGHRIPVEWAEEALFLSERPRPMEAATPVPRPRKRRGGEPAWPKKPGPTPALARVPARAPAPAPTAPLPAPFSAPAPPPVPAEGEAKKKRRRRRRRKKVDGAPPQSGADQVEADLTPLGI
jgi:ATP-dependent RNA helicase RhlB